MKVLLRLIPWLILLISFAILAVFYNSLPGQILIARSFFGNEAVTAQKTLFTVFRVPLIETVCAAAIELMRRKSAAVNAESALMWIILLYTVSLKSLFQSLEVVATENSANLFFYLTIGIIASGILAALFAGRHFLANFARPEWNLGSAEKGLLIFFAVSYLGLAIVPILVYK